VTAPGQRAVPVKKTCAPFTGRTLAFFLSIAWISPAFAQDAGVSDRPTAVRLDSGLLLSPPAEKKLDDELKRLQEVERQHRSESWVTVVMVSSAVGLVTGFLVGSLVVTAVLKKP
jgi:hypothetical protein